LKRKIPGTSAILVTLHAFYEIPESSAVLDSRSPGSVSDLLGVGSIRTRASTFASRPSVGSAVVLVATPSACALPHHQRNSGSDRSGTADVQRTRCRDHRHAYA
jgi:hypothetical protein